jgi:tight adherence protein C
VTTPQIALLVLLFFSAAGATAALVSYFMPDPMRARVRQVAGKESGTSAPATPVWQSKIVAALAPAGKLSLPKEGWADSAIRRRFMQAGFRGQTGPIVFYGCKTVLTFAFPLSFMGAVGIGTVSLVANQVLAIILVLGAMGYYLPNLYLRRRIEKRQQEIFECLPDAVDLMTIMVEAGLGLDAAIARVAEEIGTKSRSLADEFKLVGLELRAGATRDYALRNLALRTGVAEVEMFVAMLVQTDRFGTSLAQSLRVHSDAMRTKRRLRAEEAAAKIAVKLLFPLIFCIFPSIMVVLIGPAAIAIYRSFFSMATR